jgi:hypothetical protein
MANQVKIRQAARALLAGLLALAWVLGGMAQAEERQRVEPVPQAPGGAQSNAAAGAATDAADDPRQLVAEMQVLQDRLVDIQSTALERNRPLQSEAEGLQEKMLTVMRADGFDPMQSLNHIALIQQKIERGDLPPEEREALLREAIEEQRQLQEAERAALENDEVQQAHTKFIENLLTAMQKVDPETETLIQQLEAKSEQLQDWQVAKGTQAAEEG